VKANKEHFFLTSVFKKQSYAFKENDEQIIKAIQEFRNFFPELQFAETEFPFLHQSVNKDVLSPFFDLKPELPNFVFIIVEGLGNDLFRNEFNFMPFLDSLSKKSLSWEYCLSVSPRTFGVLPALFGASPLGEKGFLAQYPNNPEYNSLLRILHRNNYINHFFYGGWISFDNMEYFFNHNYTTYLEGDDWDKEIAKKEMGNYLGCEDHLLYEQALQKLNKNISNPRIDIYMTISTHEPWEYPRSSDFQNIVKNRIDNDKSLSIKQSKLTEIYGKPVNTIKVLGCFAYSDWALKQLIEGYKKRDDFDNTIFIITGDHSAYAKQFGGFANYNVPLIIYSTMLKTEKNMKGVVSHRDITPSLLSLLQNNYNIVIPKEATWLNTSLDTSLSFNATTFSPLQLIDHSVGGILHKNYMLCEGILEELTDCGSVKISNPTIFHKINRLQALYQSLDLYILKNDALIRNSYSFKELTHVISNIEDTISKSSYFEKKSNLHVVKGPEGRNTTLYFDNSNLFPLSFLTFPIPNNIGKFKVDIEFLIFIINDSEKSLELVTDLTGVSYQIDAITFDNHNRWYSYKNSFTFKKEMWESLNENSSFLIHLLNLNGLEGYIDNIKIKIMADL
jgi:hypothetical protein